MNVPQCAGDRVYVFEFQVRHKKYFIFAIIKTEKDGDHLERKN